MILKKLIRKYSKDHLELNDFYIGRIKDFISGSTHIKELLLKDLSDKEYFEELFHNWTVFNNMRDRGKIVKPCIDGCILAMFLLEAGIRFDKWYDMEYLNSVIKDGFDILYDQIIIEGV